MFTMAFRSTIDATVTVCRGPYTDLLPGIFKRLGCTTILVYAESHMTIGVSSSLSS